MELYKKRGLEKISFPFNCLNYIYHMTSPLFSGITLCHKDYVHVWPHVTMLQNTSLLAGNVITPFLVKSRLSLQSNKSDYSKQSDEQYFILTVISYEFYEALQRSFCKFHKK